MNIPFLIIIFIIFNTYKINTNYLKIKRLKFSFIILLIIRKFINIKKNKIKKIIF